MYSCQYGKHREVPARFVSLPCSCFLLGLSPIVHCMYLHEHHIRKPSRQRRILSKQGQPWICAASRQVWSSSSSGRSQKRAGADWWCGGTAAVAATACSQRMQCRSSCSLCCAVFLLRKWHSTSSRANFGMPPCIDILRQPAKTRYGSGSLSHNARLFGHIVPFLPWKVLMMHRC